MNWKKGLSQPGSAVRTHKAPRTPDRSGGAGGCRASGAVSTLCDRVL